MEGEIVDEPGTDATAEEIDQYGNEVLACGVIAGALAACNERRTVFEFHPVYSPTGQPTNALNVRMVGILRSSYRVTIEIEPGTDIGPPQEGPVSDMDEVASQLFTTFNQDDFDRAGRELGPRPITRQPPPERNA